MRTSISRCTRRVDGEFHYGHCPSAARCGREADHRLLHIEQVFGELAGGKRSTSYRQPICSARTRAARCSSTKGLCPSGVERLLYQLNALVDAGNTVIVADHDISVAAASDWVIDVGPGAGDDGGKVVASELPADMAETRASRTAPYLTRALPRALLVSQLVKECSLDCDPCEGSKPPAAINLQHILEAAGLMEFRDSSLIVGADRGEFHAGQTDHNCGLECHC